MEPQEKEVRLRYRLDGVLTDIIDFDHETYRLLSSRVKLISGLKLNITSEAQDGRFSIKVDDESIEIRTSVLPGPYGEAIVLRVLNPKTLGVPLEALGIEPRLMEIIQKEISKPNGMILTTGPTGSGKTTTLYAFLSKIYDPQIKVITIEDPIEYHLKGIVQTQVDRKNYTFASGLRSALRQDPDVIMVGEIRDAEVAETAINASLTGHLVFSTLHTNDAAGTFPRLIDLKVNPKVISSALTLALAQRLVRKLCEQCRKEITLGEKDQKIVESVLASIQDKSQVPENHTRVYAPGGCGACNGTGYKGRIGIFEGIRVDKKIEDVVEKNPSEREIWAAAAGQGILTMQQDGVVKVLRGVTSFEELGRVIDLEEIAG
jgi:type II secretory ATPase GspE/PulE/Tfp pilus assembly ATPase PilB-like protein